MSSKGQVTIPAAMQRDLRLVPGTKLLVVPVADGMLLLRRPPSLTDALAGSLADVYGDPDRYVAEERASWDPPVAR